MFSFRSAGDLHARVAGRMTIPIRPWVLHGMAALTLLVGAASVSAQGTIRVSIDNNGSEGNDHSWQAWLSGNGRFVVFESLADNLVPDDSNGEQDIFVHDTHTSETVRVSVADDGSEGNDESARPAISADGRYVVFQSKASNLVPHDTNGWSDIFVYDLHQRTIQRVSVSSEGEQANNRSLHPHISLDGRTVVFHSEATNFYDHDTNIQWDVYAHDLDTHETTIISLSTEGEIGNDWSEHAQLGHSGRIVVYHSAGDNLVPNDHNGLEDIFVTDRDTLVTTRLSVNANGIEGNERSAFPSFSADERWVVFESEASNLVPGDTNGDRDIFVCDLHSGALNRVSVPDAGGQSNGDSYTAGCSADGRFVVFMSSADNLVSDDNNNSPDVFVRDRFLQRTYRVSNGRSGEEANGGSTYPTISNSGRYVACQSFARNLVDDDNNVKSDIFRVDRGPVALDLWPPVPGIAGQANALSAYAAGPGREVWFVFGFEAGSTIIPGCDGVRLQIARPHIAGSSTANLYGRAMIERMVPESARGLQVFFQALEPESCRISNRIRHRFE